MQDHYSHVFFIGIGGIGMSALARYYKIQGYNVAGYDRTETPLTKTLCDEGITIFYEDNTELIAPSYKDAKQCLVVYTPAIPQDAAILNYYIDHNFEIKKRAQVLGLLTKTQQSICVGGTHGKTTISTMISHLLYDSSVGCNAFLGGISQNYKSNVLTNTESDKVVIEADEFDRSFLHLFPHTAVISAIDADHLDIYGTHDSLLDAFQEFTSQINHGGTLLLKDSLDFTPRTKDDVTVYTYNIEEGDFHTKNLKLIDGLYQFDLVTPNKTITGLKLGIPGRVNVENAVAALSVAHLHGASDDELRTSISNFKGIHRRFQYHVKTADTVYIDDYAHHPEELKATISSVRAIYPNSKITGIFQPHLFSRTQDFAPAFSKSLSLLDELWLMDIYPARELPIPGVTSDLIMSKVNCQSVLADATTIKQKVKEENVEVLLTLGAGDVDRLVPVIKDILLTKNA